MSVRAMSIAIVLAGTVVLGVSCGRPTESVGGEVGGATRTLAITATASADGRWSAEVSLAGRSIESSGPGPTGIITDLKHYFPVREVEEVRLHVRADPSTSWGGADLLLREVEQLGVAKIHVDLGCTPRLAEAGGVPAAEGGQRLEWSTTARGAAPVTLRVGVLLSRGEGSEETLIVRLSVGSASCRITRKRLLGRHGSQVEECLRQLLPEDNGRRPRRLRLAVRAGAGSPLRCSEMMVILGALKELGRLDGLIFSPKARRQRDDSGLGSGGR